MYPQTIPVLLLFSLLSTQLVTCYYQQPTTTEFPIEYEFVPQKIVTTTTQSPLLLNDVTNLQPMTTTVRPSLENLLTQCDPDDQGEESVQEEQKVGKIFQYVEALKDQIQGNSTEQLVQRKLPDVTEETEEVFPLQMVKSFQVADFNDLNRINEPQPKFQYVPSRPSHREPIKAAVFTRYSIEARPFGEMIPRGAFNRFEQKSEYEPQFLNEITDIEPQIIEVLPGNFRPLEIHFKSTSRRIKMVQRPPERQEYSEPEVTRSEEEPQRLIHTVRKPIIQEVREIVTPYRKVYQEIQPVVEEIQTIVSSRRGGSNKFNPPERFTTPPESFHREPVITTTVPPPLLPIVESLTDVENQIIEQKPDIEPQLSSSSTVEHIVSPLSVSAPMSSKPLFSSNLLSSFMNPKSSLDSTNNPDDVVYHHLKSRKYRRNVTIKKRSKSGRKL